MIRTTKHRLDWLSFLRRAKFQPFRILVKCMYLRGVREHEHAHEHVLSPIRHSSSMGRFIRVLDPRILRSPRRLHESIHLNLGCTG